MKNEITSRRLNLLCLAFHNPANLSLLLDRTKYKFTPIYEDKDLPEIEKSSKVKTSKIRVLFFVGIDRLISYGASLKLDNKTKRLNKFKIIIFDTPQNFLKYKLEVADAIPRSNGIWTFKRMEEENFAKLLSNLEEGVVTKFKKEFKNAQERVAEERVKATRKRGPRKPTPTPAANAS